MPFLFLRTVQNGIHAKQGVQCFPCTYPCYSPAITGGGCCNLCLCDQNFSYNIQRGRELRRRGWLVRLLPGINIGLDRGIHRLIQPLTNTLAILKQNLTEILDAQAGDQAVGALQVFRVLSIVLHKATNAALLGCRQARWHQLTAPAV